MPDFDRDLSTRLAALTGDASPLDAAILPAIRRRAAAERRRRRGVAVSALLTDGDIASGVPNIVGVRTGTGEELNADLVVDAAGRRSSLPAMLTALGARAPEEELEDSGFMYYGRHFRSADGSIPPLMCGILQPWGTVSTITLPGDNGTWVEVSRVPRSTSKPTPFNTSSSP